MKDSLHSNLLGLSILFLGVYIQITSSLIHIDTEAKQALLDTGKSVISAGLLAIQVEKR